MQTKNYETQFKYQYTLLYHYYIFFKFIFSINYIGYINNAIIMLRGFKNGQID